MELERQWDYVLGQGIDLAKHITQTEQGLVYAALQRTHGNKAQAAKLLGLRRTTLMMKLQKWSRHGRTTQNTD